MHEIVGHRRLAGNHDVDEHVIGAQPAATGADDLAALADLGLDALLGKLLLEGLGDRLGPGGKPPGPLTDQNFYLFSIRGHIF